MHVGDCVEVDPEGLSERVAATCRALVTEHWNCFQRVGGLFGSATQVEMTKDQGIHVYMYIIHCTIQCNCTCTRM